MKPPKCGLCGEMEWRHVCASNRNASNNVLAKTDRQTVKQMAKDACDQAVVPAPAVRAHAYAEPGMAKQRWAREAYNAYQREYMRKRRAK